MIYIFDTKSNKIRIEEFDNIANLQQFEIDLTDSYGEYWSYDYWDLLHVVFEYYDDNHLMMINAVADSKKIMCDFV